MFIIITQKINVKLERQLPNNVQPIKNLHTSRMHKVLILFFFEHALAMVLIFVFSIGVCAATAD